MTTATTGSDGLGFGEGPRWRDGLLWFSDLYRRAVYTVAPDVHADLSALADHHHHLDDLICDPAPNGLAWLDGGRTLVLAETLRLRLTGQVNTSQIAYACSPGGADGRPLRDDRPLERARDRRRPDPGQDRRDAGTTSMRVVVVGGRGKTGRAVRTALSRRDVASVVVGRAEWPRLSEVLRGSHAVYLIAPNLHEDEPAYVAEVLAAMTEAGVARLVYHSVAAPYTPEMPHHLGKARAEDLVRRSGLAWTILQPGAYLQNLDLTRDLDVPYAVNARFGFADLEEVAEAAAVVLTEVGHVGATYELASRDATPAELAAENGHRARRVDAVAEHPWLRAMFAYYDRHGLPVGTGPLDHLLRRRR